MLQKLNNKPKIRYANINGQVIGVPAFAKYVFQCKRGFYWHKDRKPEVVMKRVNDWTEIKELVQYAADSEQGQAGWGYHTAPVKNWQTRVWMTTEEAPANPDKPIIYLLG